jgi:arginyl-tRNA synthetase
MPDLLADLRARIQDALIALLPELPRDLLARVELSPARDPAHGDLATNAAMLAARPAGRNPRALAEALAEKLRALAEIAEATPAGPGFVNLRLRPVAWQGILPGILRAGEAYGDGSTGAGIRVNVEYVSANPTGPMHIGHCRGAVVGDALANLLTKAGYAVTKEYYINDAGAQVTALAWAAYWRYLQAIGTQLTEAEFAAEVPGGLQYRGDYLVPVGEALAARHGAALATPAGTIAAPELWLDIVRDHTIAAMMEQVRADLAALGVTQEVFSSERALVASGAADALIERLRADGLIYEGVLEPPKGKTPEDWEPRPQTLFRATKFGDDVDRPLRKSDGSNTYFANDIAYHADKVDRGFTRLIDVLGADHGGYVTRLAAAVTAVSGGRAKLEAVLCQIVHVMKGGQPVRMSKRAGSYVTLRDLLDEVGKDAVRFTMLTRKADAQMVFDLDAVVAQTRDNPVFYVQYAHARCRSVLRAAAAMPALGDIGEAALAEAPLDSLTAEPELALLRRLAGWPRLVQAAAEAGEPHRIAFYLYDLAADFHMLWNRGKDDAALRFLLPDRPAETRARLALVAATAITLRSGLAVMGVTPVEEMR